MPWSGLVFGLAFLARPEAPLFMGLPMLWLAFGIFNGRNIARGVIFLLVAGALEAFRYAYFGDLVPAPMRAKTGDLAGQLQSGWGTCRATWPTPAR